MLAKVGSSSATTSACCSWPSSFSPRPASRWSARASATCPATSSGSRSTRTRPRSGSAASAAGSVTSPLETVPLLRGRRVEVPVLAGGIDEPDEIARMLDAGVQHHFGPGASTPAETVEGFRAAIAAAGEEDGTPVRDTDSPTARQGGRGDVFLTVPKKTPAKTWVERRAEMAAEGFRHGQHTADRRMAVRRRTAHPPVDRRARGDVPVVPRTAATARTASWATGSSRLATRCAVLGVDLLGDRVAVPAAQRAGVPRGRPRPRLPAAWSASR